MRKPPAGPPADPPVDPPVVGQRPCVLTVHGIERTDPYAWLRDDNWQKVMREPETLRADIRAHLEAENEYTHAVLAPTDALRETLFAELKGRLKPDDSSVPAPDGSYAYYYRYEVDGQHPRYCRKDRDRDREQVLYDAHAASKGHAYFDLGGLSHSPDHTHLAYATDIKGSEYYTVRVRRLSDGADLDDRLENTSGHAVWAPDGQHLFYTELDEHHRPCRVVRHRLGTPQADDVVVYEEADPGFFVGVGRTENRGHIVIDAHDHTTTEIRVIDGTRPTATPTLIWPRRTDIEYQLSQHGDSFWIATNDGAEDFEIVRVPVADPSQKQTVVPHRPGTLILATHAFADHVVRLERHGGLPRIVVRRVADGEEHRIEFPEEAYALELLPGYEYETTTVRFRYSSPSTPAQTFDYDMDTRTRTLLKEQEIPSGHDASQYRVARLQAPSHDGELVPVTLLWHRDTPIDATAPILLYGYGAYGITIEAGFSPHRLSLVRRGFIYAIAHVRGGKDKGYAWYRRGKLADKPNTFKDFIAAAEHLIEAGYATAGNITAHGGSAGGMLVGAVVNMRPDLWKAAVGEVPFVDVLTTMCDADLPLTPPEWPQWGNPLQSEDDYRTIAAYSPYDNVSSQIYPHILATAGLTDPRVTYWEPAKWVARLRQRGVGDNMLLLKTYMEAGHGGAAGRYEKLREVAVVFAFVLLAHDRLDAPIQA